MTDHELEQLLSGTLSRQANDANDAAVARVMTRLEQKLPPQRRQFWRLPAVLLDWQFAPAWPRMAALGACALVGFVVGIAGIDRQFDPAPGAASQPGFGSVIFEPEPLTGARP